MIDHDKENYIQELEEKIDKELKKRFSELPEEYFTQRQEQDND